MPMEEEVKTWKERLMPLLKGKSLMLTDDDKTQSIYSAIRDNPDEFAGKKFTVRTHPSTHIRRVYRIQ